MAYQFVRTSSQRLSTATFPITSTPITMAAWVRRQSSNTMGVVTLLTSGFEVDHYRLAIQSTGAIRAFAFQGSTFVSGTSDTTEVVANGAWAHAAGVFSSGNSRTAYLNAAPATTNTQTVTTASITQARIGCSSGSGGEDIILFDGDIADVGIWDVALSAEEIASLADGVACNRIRPQSLKFYAPLIRDLIDVRGGLAITNNNGATVANHPRIYQ